MNPKIYPCLWFDGKAAEAAEFYCSVFKDAKILYAGPMAHVFDLHGCQFMALNGAHENNFNDSVSFVINCKDQEEIDYYWYKLSEEGEESMCGWLKDKYGVSWQILPEELGTLMADPDKAERIAVAFSSMKKLEIAVLQNA